MGKKSDGFTLIEIVVIIATLGIIAAIVVPRLIGFNSMAEERVCATNRKTVERVYITFLLENEHGESVFNQFLIGNFDGVCPVGGVVTYVDGTVMCNMHEDGIEGGEDEGPGEEVPWL